MPLAHGEVRVGLSTPVSFAMPTSSSPRRSAYLTHSYKGSTSSYSSTTRSSHLRATSLDRSSLREPTSYYRPSDTSSYKYAVGNRPVLRSIASNMSTDSGRSRPDVDILSRISSLSINTPTPLKQLSSSRKGSDALHETGSPVLTNYKDLSEGSSYRYLSARVERRLENRGVGSSLSSYSETSSPLKSVVTSGSSTSLASAKADVDENSNRNSSPHRTRYDTNHNVVSRNPGKEDDKGYPSTSCVARSLRNQSSSSSSSPASSTDDITELSATTRARRSSALTGSTSGYGSDNASTSNSIPRRSGRDASDKGGLVGLRNLGNTCFMNSVLQCLSNTKPLLDYCINDAYLSDINISTSGMKGALIKAFASLLQSMWKGSGDAAVNPQAFKSQIQKFAPRFMGYSQQDAQEFLRYLLQGLHEDVNRVTTKPKPIVTDIEQSWSESQKATESWKRYLRIDDSKIVDIFVGQLKSCLQCTVCGHCSVTFDPFWDLSLPIPKAAGQVRLNQCFDLFTKEEILDGDEKPTCSQCKTRRKCTKKMTIHKFPRILVIHLKRFSPMERYRSKLSTYVDFPLVGLDLSASNTSRSQPCVYNLYAVSNHSGTIYSGHYTAHCRHPHTGEWYDFNDSRVNPMSTSSVVSSEAYVLFYELANQSSRL